VTKLADASELLEISKNEREFRIPQELWKQYEFEFLKLVEKQSCRIILKSKEREIWDRNWLSNFTHFMEFRKTKKIFQFRKPNLSSYFSNIFSKLCFVSVLKKLRRLLAA
jgi:hypothetical protein